MSTIYNVRYLIQPKQILLTNLGERHTFTTDYFINNREVTQSLLSIDDEHKRKKNNLTKAKMVFLLNIISNLRRDKYIETTVRDAIELFGTPPKYDENVFDQWWTIQRIGLIQEVDYEETILMASYSDCNMLGTTSNSDTNNFFSDLCQLKNKQSDK